MGVDRHAGLRSSKSGKSGEHNKAYEDYSSKPRVSPTNRPGLYVFLTSIAKKYDIPNIMSREGWWDNSVSVE